jgi:hypothetical protein
MLTYSETANSLEQFISTICNSINPVSWTDYTLGLKFSGIDPRGDDFLAIKLLKHPFREILAFGFNSFTKYNYENTEYAFSLP